MAQYCIKGKRIINVCIPKEYDLDKIQIGIPVMDDEAERVCSAIFALIAIIISLLSDEVRNIAIDYMSDSMVIRCTLCVAIVISISCMVKSLVVGLINYCRKKYIFK